MRSYPFRRAVKHVLFLLVLVSASPTAAFGHTQSTLDPETETAREINELWWIMFGVSAVVVVVVIALVLVAVLRRGARISEGDDRRALRWVAIGGVGIPLVILAVVFRIAMGTVEETSAEHIHDPELEIQVVGHQYFWEVRYPGGVVTANEIHIPARTPVAIKLNTNDVIHSFWVPRLTRKIDLLPGRTTELRLVADEPDVYRGQCAEFCGVQHANMAFRVVAEEPPEFDDWLRNEAAPASRPTTESEERGRAVFFAKGCDACHTLRGTPATGDAGPDLTHLAARDTIAAGTIPNARGYLGGWVLDPQGIKPGSKMPSIPMDGREFRALLDFLESLD